MRFYRRERTIPKDGDLLTRRFFAWLPFRIGNETRWLETVQITYRYNLYRVVEKTWLFGYQCDSEQIVGKWEAMSFADKDSSMESIKI